MYKVFIRTVEACHRLHELVMMVTAGDLADLLLILSVLELTRVESTVLFLSAVSVWSGQQLDNSQKNHLLSMGYRQTSFDWFFNHVS